MRKLCWHMFEGGRGAMGDAYTCLRCGYSRYPEFFFMLLFWKIIGRVIKEGDKRHSFVIRKAKEERNETTGK